VAEQYIFREKHRKKNSGAQALSSSNQKYLAFIKISPNMAAKLYEPLMEFSENPINGVKLEEAYQVFGEWDFAVLFQADSNANALHFVGDKIRLVEGVLETFTVPLTPVKDYRK
jgi:DNA-binding Lrp family transcriptional regulator